MPSKQNNIYKETFDTIAFLGFVALLSVAATKAGAWEQKLCEPKAFVEKSDMKKMKVESTVVLLSRKVR